MSELTKGQQASIEKINAAGAAGAAISAKTGAQLAAMGRAVKVEGKSAGKGRAYYRAA